MGEQIYIKLISLYKSIPLVDFSVNLILVYSSPMSPSPCIEQTHYDGIPPLKEGDTGKPWFPVII
jgi:hypothetical protein